MGDSFKDPVYGNALCIAFFGGARGGVAGRLHKKRHSACAAPCLNSIEPVFPRDMATAG
jgi:hypothetical protein